MDVIQRFEIGAMDLISTLLTILLVSTEHTEGEAV